MSKSICYDCTHRRDIPGNTHSRCAHPEVGPRPSDAAVQLVIQHAARSLKIRVTNQNVVKKGWFAWPFNFDPTWLENCNGFEQKEKFNPTEG